MNECGAAPPAFYPHSNLTVPAIYEAFEASDPSERVFGFGEHGLDGEE